MIIVLFIISILMLIVGAILIKHVILEEGACAIAVVGFIASIITVTVAVCLGVDVTELSTVDARIEMYQEENANIEQQIATVVTQYQEYEKDIFAQVTPESAITLVSLYPELKSDTLVASQIEVYVKNNETITALREEKINGSVARWWLYFGN